MSYLKVLDQKKKKKFLGKRRWVYLLQNFSKPLLCSCEIMTLREAGIGYWVFQSSLTTELLEKHLEILWKLL